MILPALGAALDGADEARRRTFFAHLAALDRLVRSGEEVSEAVLLGALLTTPPGADAEALLAALVATSRLPRKIAERTQLALHAQRAFRDPARKRRRRGGGQHHFDALQLLRISVEATGDGREVLERWNASQPAQGQPRGDGAVEHREPVDDAAPRGGERGRSGRGRGAHRRAEAGAPQAPREADVEAEGELEIDADTGPDEGPDEADGEAGIRTVTISGSSAVGGSEGAGGRRRRRRRGGRRRRRRGEGAPAGGGAPPAGS